ncbi:unnamed protein product [Calicophoron daubneyi]|uniref:Cyclic nucleotide-binding domain-containing protein n=1 Tax=Calicophoron daubneyi TaxID=300641 RepID=A0AAV2TFT5_CALDB
MQFGFDVPEGFVELLQDFTVAVLRYKPNDIYAYAADYFTRLNNQQREKAVGNKVKIFVPPVIITHQKSLDTDNDDDGDESSSGMSYSRSSGLSSESSSEAELKNVRTRRPSVAAEPYNPDSDEDDDEDDDPIFPKTDEQRAMLTDVCKKIMIFRNLEEEQLAKVVDAMFERTVTAGDRVIEQGEEGDNFYVIERGFYDVFIKDEKGNQKKVHAYENEGSFGELALMYNAPRSATVVATTDGRVWCMNRNSFRKLVLSQASHQRRAFLELLHSVQMLQPLSSYERMSLADALVKRTYQDGEYIIREGDPGTEMFFIMEGRVKVVQRDEILNELSKGDYFGELALMSDQPRAASVCAVGKTVVAVLGAESFERLLGPCLDVMQRNKEKYVVSPRQSKT